MSQVYISFGENVGKVLMGVKKKRRGVKGSLELSTNGINDVSNYSTMEQSGEAEKRADKAIEMGGGTFWSRIGGRTPFDFGENAGKVLMEMEKRRGEEGLYM
jgi:hypothetical protein